MIDVEHDPRVVTHLESPNQTCDMHHPLPQHSVIIL